MDQLTTSYLVALPLALIFSLLLSPPVRAIAIRLAFLDVPDGKRYHSSATPLLGGIAVIASVLFAWFLTHLVTRLEIQRAELLLATGLLLSFGLGIYDDKYGMKAKWKLIGQFVCSLLLVTACYAGGWMEGKWFFPILLVWVVGIMNAVNFLDNMDGIAGGMTALASLAFVFIFAMQRQWVGVIVAGATCGASAGFLRLNFPPAKIFLGDAGSLPLGFLLGALSIMASRSASAQEIVGPLIVLGYPTFDITFVTIIRIRENRSIYRGGKDHSSHRLAALPLSPRKTALVIYAFCLALGGIAILIEKLRAPTLSFSVLAVLIAFLVSLGFRLDKVKSHLFPQERSSK